MFHRWSGGVRIGYDAKRRNQENVRSTVGVVGPEKVTTQSVVTRDFYEVMDLIRSVNERSVPIIKRTVPTQRILINGFLLNSTTSCSESS